MKRYIQHYSLIIAALLLASCHVNKKEVSITKQSDFPAPPVAQVIPDTFTNFGQKRIDPYFWIKDKTNPEVIDYLAKENSYTDIVMSSTETLQETIYNEIIGRIKEDDESYPTFQNGYYYYSRTEQGKQYRTYCRRKAPWKLPGVIFDLNEMAEGDRRSSSRLLHQSR